MSANHRTNDLCTRLKRFSLAIIELYVSLPRQCIVSQILGKQLLRSATSVGANYTEAQRARSKAEFVSKVGESLRELQESHYWLELLVESGRMEAERSFALVSETNELIAVLVSCLRTSKRS
jgi:four helix bundle protein